MCTSRDRWGGMKGGSIDDGEDDDRRFNGIWLWHGLIRVIFSSAMVTVWVDTCHLE